jgi:hypothetical protein
MEKFNQENFQKNNIEIVKIDEAIKKFENTADALGLGIDKGIIEQVALLDLLGYFTTASCEGHIDSGLPYGWVDFGSETEKREQELSKKGESVYWNVFNNARNIANKLELEKFPNFKKGDPYTDEMCDFWDETLNFQIKNHSEYINYLEISKEIRGERDNLRNNIKKLIDEYNEKNPELKIILQKLGLVRIGFTTDIDSDDELNEEERIFIKNKSDVIAENFKKFLKEKYYENLL